MLEPYAAIRDRHSHGDVIVWPLKALCDYLEATDDLAVPRRAGGVAREDDLEQTARRDPVAAHVDKLLATVRERFIPGTHLVRYGEGDWNNSLQPADPTHARLDGEQLDGGAAVPAAQPLRRGAEPRRPVRGGRGAQRARGRDARRISSDHLIRDGTVAGYALFDPGGASSRS